MVKVGSVLVERYDILERIGSGGMSNVYKAKDHKLGRFVAIKVLKEEFCLDENFVSKFKVEAQSAASLSHNNIVNIYDVGQDGRNHFIVMEYLEGETLKDYIANNGKLSDQEILKIGVSIGAALEHAHSNHIIHRDIKPQNIMITNDGKVKVMDFGIAKITTGATIEMRDTASGSVHYIAPEQARGGYQDNKSDIYSLGVVMYEMATGVVPFDGDNAVNVALMQIHDEMPNPHDLNEHLSQNITTIINKSTQKKAAMRYQSAFDMVSDIKKCMSNPDDVLVYTIDNAPEETMIMSHEEMKHIWSKNEVLEYSGKKDPLDKLVAGLGIVFAVLLVSIIAGVVYNKVAKEYIPVNVTVPNIVGMTEEEARSSLDDISLSMNVVAREYNDEYPEGEVMTQQPGLDSVVRDNTTIDVEVSKGVELTRVIGVMYDDYKYATTQLEEAGFNVQMISDYNNVVPVGQVYKQTPSANESVIVNSDVTIYVSKGKEEVLTEVPDVSGLQLTEGESLLRIEGFEIGTITEIHDDNIQEGYILSTSVEAGRMVKEGYIVDLHVSLGPKIVEVTRDLIVNDVKRHGQDDYVLKLTIDFDGNETVIYEESVTSADFPMVIPVTGVGTGIFRVYNDDEQVYPQNVYFTEEPGGE